MNTLRYYKSRISEFGLLFFFRYHIIGRKKGKRYKQSVILDYVTKDIRKLGSVIGRNIEGVLPDEIQPIWVCWWQGEAQMPPVVKTCYCSLLSHSNGHPVHLICKDNIAEYVTMPPVIEQKRETGLITLTHFSDLLRVALLEKHGGLWIDATIFATGDVPREIPYFYTIKQKCIDESYVSDYRWTGYFLGGSKNNPIFSEINKYFTYYWTKHDSLIDYYFLDYVIAALVNISLEYKDIIEQVRYSNPQNHVLAKCMDLPYDEESFMSICADTDFHKLSWKDDYLERNNLGQKTFYGMICSL